MCTDSASVMGLMRTMAMDEGLVLFSLWFFALVVNLIGNVICRDGHFAPSLRMATDTVVFFRHCTLACADLNADRGMYAAAGHMVGQLVTFRATRWVGQSQTVRSLLATLPGLWRVLLANAHDHGGFAFTFFSMTHLRCPAPYTGPYVSACRLNL